MTGILTVSFTWCLLFDNYYIWSVLAVKIQSGELNWHIHVCILLWWYTIKVWNGKEKELSIFATTTLLTWNALSWLLAVTLYLCVTWYNQGRVLFFSMELSAHQKKQAYHVCRLGKKWIENHGHALFFSFAFAIIVLPILLTNSYDF